MKWHTYEIGKPLIHKTEGTDGKVVTDSTECITLNRRHPGTWYTVDKFFYRGVTFYILESEDYGEDIAHVVVDSQAKIYLTDIWDNSLEELKSFLDSSFDILEGITEVRNERLKGEK